jgi:hypothetical protein
MFASRKPATACSRQQLHPIIRANDGDASGDETLPQAAGATKHRAHYAFDVFGIPQEHQSLMGVRKKTVGSKATATFCPG